MKNIICLMLVFTAILMSGCSKDENNENGLVGTSWEYTENGWRLIEFHSNTTFTLQYSGIIIDDKNEGTITGTYNYDPPVVTFVVEGEETIGTISGGNLTIGDITFIKQ